MLARTNKNGPVSPHCPELGPCWLWEGALTDDGYGRVSTDVPDARSVGAHRASYELARGPIQAGLHLDHLCRVRHCVNPAHLEPVTCAVNIARGETGAAEARKTHCRYGHAYDARNTYRNAKGHRYCRKCNAGHSLRRKAKQRAARRDEQAPREARPLPTGAP